MRWCTCNWEGGGDVSPYQIGYISNSKYNVRLKLKRHKISNGTDKTIYYIYTKKKKYIYIYIIKFSMINGAGFCNKLSNIS